MNQTELARKAKITPSRTVYTSWGKGCRQPLRFSKYGNPYIEQLYSTHYVSRRLKQAKQKPPDATLGPEPKLESRPTSNLPQ
jgi:hypothetical protein